eukprot:2831027-Rhodomonas_salina.1
MEEGHLAAAIPYASIVQTASTSWRLTRRSQQPAKSKSGKEPRIYLVRIDLAERLLTPMPAGSAFLRSQTVLKSTSNIYLSYKLKTTTHHQKLNSLTAKWKSMKKGAPLCLLDSAGIGFVHTLQDEFFAVLRSFILEVIAHRHFIDKEFAAISVRLELQYREFVICRHKNNQFVVSANANGGDALSSCIIEIDCSSGRILCQDNDGERVVKSLDSVLTKLVGRDTSQDTAKPESGRDILPAAPQAKPLSSS